MPTGMYIPVRVMSEFDYSYRDMFKREAANEPSAVFLEYAKIWAGVAPRFQMAIRAATNPGARRPSLYPSEMMMSARFFCRAGVFCWLGYSRS